MHDLNLRPEVLPARGHVVVVEHLQPNRFDHFLHLHATAIRQRPSHPVLGGSVFWAAFTPAAMWQFSYHRVIVTVGAALVLAAVGGLPSNLFLHTNLSIGYATLGVGSLLTAAVGYRRQRLLPLRWRRVLDNRAAAASTAPSFGPSAPARHF